MSIESVMSSNHLFLFWPLLLLPSILPSIRVFSDELALHTRLSKYWSFSFIISPSSEYSGLISFRIDWFDLLVVQVTLVVQETSPKPQFESVYSLVLSLLYGPTLTSVGFLDSSVGKESACNAGDSGSMPGLERSAGELIRYPIQYSWASFVAKLVKNPTVMWETWVWSLGWEDPLEKGKATHSSILPWWITWPVVSMGLQRFGHDWSNFTFTFSHLYMTTGKTIALTIWMCC